MADYKVELSAGSYLILSGRATLSVHAPLPENDPMLSIIGRVANQWAHIEHVLDLIIWDLLGDLEPEKGAAITVEVGPSPRFKAIIRLARIVGLSDEIINRTTNFMSKTVERAEKRHRIVHDPWYAEMTTKSPSQFKGVKPRIKYVDAKYVSAMKETDAKDIDEAINEGKDTLDQVTGLRDAIASEKAALKR